jgi:cytochrome oxidase Cu insertion factor (SCO1/SenC/PrrC family)
MPLTGVRACAVLALALAGPAHAHSGDPAVALDFVPPAPGTYRLPSIQAAPQGEVVDVAGKARALADFTRGKLTLLGLIYTRCADPEGCPRGTWAFQEVRELLRASPDLERRVRLVSLSFDPAHDTPALLRTYGAAARGRQPGADWVFLTTRSASRIAPILEGFGQDLRVAADSDAAPGSEEFTHSLKVFLIDPRGEVREIYSTAYLLPRMIVNDLQTLALEAGARARR